VRPKKSAQQRKYLPCASEIKHTAKRGAHDKIVFSGSVASC
jgi:hypothetical protein